MHPTARILRGFLLLGLVISVAVICYRFVFELEWHEATWLTIVTITGVGYGEESVKTPSFQLFTILVILFGLSSAAYAVTGLIQLVLEGELERVLGKRRMDREISKLQGHVIICGYGRLGECLAKDLTHEKRQFIIVENNVEEADDAKAKGYLVLVGDATEEATLREAGLESARSLVTSLPSDAANVFITLTARNLNPNVQIISRAEQSSTERKLRQAGANKIVLPALTSARQMVRMLTRPTTAHLIDLLSEKSYLDVELDELPIHNTSKLVGVSVRQSEAHYKHRLLVVAIKRKDESMIFNPDGDFVFAEDDVAIVMGKHHDIDAFCEFYKLRS